MTTYAVIARFDDAATETLKRHKDEIKKLLAFDASGNWPPHLTLGAYEADDCREICRWTAEYAARCGRPQFIFGSIGVFCRDVAHLDTEVLYAAPTNAAALSSFYYGYHEKLDESCGPLGWQYSMKYGQPTFHSTITICKSSEFYLAMDYLRDNFAPVIATIEAIEIYELPMKLVSSCKLKG